MDWLNRVFASDELNTKGQKFANAYYYTEDNEANYQTIKTFATSATVNLRPCRPKVSKLMNPQDQAFIDDLQLDEIPWDRLASPHYRATEFPEILEALSDKDESIAHGAEVLLAANLERESILWQPTPLVMVFLARLMRCAVERYLEHHAELDAALIFRICNLYGPLLDAAEGITNGEHPNPLPAFTDMLQPANLLPTVSATHDKEDEQVVQEFYATVPENVFYSFFHYTWVILADSIEQDLRRLKDYDPNELASLANVFLDSPQYAVLKEAIAI